MEASTMSKPDEGFPLQTARLAPEDRALLQTWNPT